MPAGVCWRAGVVHTHSLPIGRFPGAARRYMATMPAWRGRTSHGRGAPARVHGEARAGPCQPDRFSSSKRSFRQMGSRHADGADWPVGSSGSADVAGRARRVARLPAAARVSLPDRAEFSWNWRTVISNGDELPQKLTVAYVAGTGPGVFKIGSPGVAQLSASGFLLPLDS